jgi:hypothetical protein
MVNEEWEDRHGFDLAHHESLPVCKNEKVFLNYEF